MRLEPSLFKSKIARRIFATFIVGALVPVIVLATLSVFHVSRQLERNGREGLYQATKGHTHAIFEHLLFCEDELKQVGQRGTQNRTRQLEKFKAIGRRYADGRYEAVLGDPITGIHLNDQGGKYLEKGKSLLVIDGNDSAKITLVQYFDTGSGAPGMVMGTIRGDYLWGLVQGNTLPALSVFAVATRTRTPLYTGIEASQLSAACLPHMQARHSLVKMDGEDWLMTTSLIFLKARFGVDDWYLMVLQPTAHVMAPVARFKLIFLLTVTLALLLVVAMSLFNLRRSLEPINALEAGARHIMYKDFKHRVRISSGDEFEALANSFNDMSRQLGRHFQFLNFQAAIDKSTLMAHQFSHIAELAIKMAREEFRFSLMAIHRVDAEAPDEPMLYMGYGTGPTTIDCRHWELDQAVINRFHPDLPWLTLDKKVSLADYLPPECIQDVGTVSVFPIFVKARLIGLLSVAGKPERPLPDEILHLTRQTADHFAVAWSNINMIQDLRRLTLGSMQALSRTVDAKSPWTAGHSARVMRIALDIARQMGMDAERIDILQQAALLHDIGKIGVSSAILDKPGQLTDAEFTAIRSHPVTGSNILAPIAAFKRVIPMVRQHHERWDGKGYPDGLAGEAITLEARILAVADVYDAIASDRPYRKGMPLSKVMEIIASESGRQFDPKIVSAFLELMNQKPALAN